MSGVPADVQDGDSALYGRARTGDAAALERLLEQYLPQLHAFVRLRLHGLLRARESSMDVVQSVCREFLSGAPFQFSGEERFRAWLFTAALNKLRDKHRFHRSDKRNVDRETPLEAEADLREAASYLTPSVAAIGNEAARALQDALDALSDEHREVVTLARVVGLPHKVIGEVMDRNEPAIRQLLARALLKLSQELRARGVDLA